MQYLTLCILYVLIKNIDLGHLTFQGHRKIVYKPVQTQLSGHSLHTSGGWPVASVNPIRSCHEVVLPKQVFGDLEVVVFRPDLEDRIGW